MSPTCIRTSLAIMAPFWAAVGAVVWAVWPW